MDGWERCLMRWRGLSPLEKHITYSPIMLVNCISVIMRNHWLATGWVIDIRQIDIIGMSRGQNHTTKIIKTRSEELRYPHWDLRLYDPGTLPFNYPSDPEREELGIMWGVHSHSGCSVGAGYYVRSSFSQWALSRSWELCEEVILTAGAQ